jgi:hypothetical protein
MEEEMIKSIEETCQVSMEKLGYDKYSINATNEEILFLKPCRNLAPLAVSADIENGRRNDQKY